MVIYIGDQAHPHNDVDLWMIPQRVHSRLTRTTPLLRAALFRPFRLHNVLAILTTSLEEAIRVRLPYCGRQAEALSADACTGAVQGGGMG